jgi:2-oxoisovalerate dehydrogenase E1 component
VSAPHDDLDHGVRDALSGRTAAVGSEALARFEVMAASRHLDLQARRMRARGQGHYTIGSAGHESNALVAAATRVGDPALLHYRSGGFYLERSRQAGRPLTDGVRDVLASMMGAVIDPASGGRHKVFGHPALAIIPQTSTIASQLPRAVGVAFAIERAGALGLPTRWAPDSIAVTSFGDASLNHSTAVGALNAAGHFVQSGFGLPILFVCEDNGLGISVSSPEHWVEQAARRPGVRYAYADGDDPDAVLKVAHDLVSEIRTTRRPGLLHLRTVRFLGHAGTDVESTYRLPAELRADLERDPIIALARSASAAPGSIDLARRYDEVGVLVADLADELIGAQTLASRAAVMAPLTNAGNGAPVTSATAPSVAARDAAFGGRRPEDAGELTLAQTINAALTDAMAARPEMLVFGEDVGRKGGVYGITRALAQRFGVARVFDTLLDEQTILGLALGLGLSGLLPVPEIQYLAYLHNAEDQLRGEAASLRFFSDATYTNPMVVRLAGLAYQKGFGGHFHNDNAVAVLRDIPGLLVAVPAHPDDAAPLLRACLHAAIADGRVAVYLEPIALYHERDLHEPGDRGWLARYSPTGTASVGRGRVHGDGPDLTLITFGNGLRMSLRVAERLAEDGFGVRVLDLRWIAPLPVEDILSAARATGRVLVVDETRHAGGVGEGVLTALVENGFRGDMARVASADSYIPLGNAANLVLLQEDEIDAAARALLPI